MNVDEFTATHTPSKRVLVVGLTGSGKSTLALELTKYYKLHWIDIENGYETILKLPKEQRDNINLIHIPDSASFPIAANSLMSLFKSYKGDICDKHGKFACALCKKEGLSFSSIDMNTMDNTKEIVVLDTATQLSSSILAYNTKDKPVDYKPERDDWGSLRKHTEFFASQFQGCPGNLIVICHATEAELEDGKRKLVPQFGSAGMSANFGSKFSHIIYCEVVNRKHKYYSASTHSNNVLTRSRTDFRIEDMSEPSLRPIFDAVLADSLGIGTGLEEVAPNQGQVASSNLREKLAAMKGNK